MVRKIQKPSDLAIELSKGKWLMVPHLQFLEYKILGAIGCPNRNLIVNMPPRHGKSEFISKYFPLWFLNQFPHKRVILVSYQKSISAGWSRKIRDLIENNSNLMNISLSKKHKKSNSFDIDQSEGGLFASGIGGALTGLGADLLIIDDPVKNDEQANSLTYRDKTWDWFNATALTRLEPGGNTIIVMTRWHDDDLTGRILSQYSEDELKSWDHIMLPALAMQNDPLNRKIGEPLWIERFPANELQKIRKRIGEYWFSALYQQEPLPSGSTIFKRTNFKYFANFPDYLEYFDEEHCLKRTSKKDLTIMATCDLAISTHETADYTVIIIFGKSHDNKIFILDIVRQRFETINHLPLIKSIFQKYRPKLIVVENVQYQKSLIQQAIKEGLPIKSLRPDKDKVSRALTIAAQMENGMVYFQKDADYLAEFEKELLNFPKSRYDDQVDAFSYIPQMIFTTSGMLPI